LTREPPQGPRKRKERGSKKSTSQRKKAHWDFKTSKWVLWGKEPGKGRQKELASFKYSMSNTI
jgi:hypothetical protein